jgi:glyoxylase-like metal-dependent hydrolase (beta-lactamase superfamily II)
MIIKETGKISRDFYSTGLPIVPVYLLDGPEPVLFDAGITPLAHHYERDLKEILGNRKPAYLFLTHSHFDHIGAASHFKSIWPDLQIGGADRCREILLKQKAIQLIRNLNQEGLNSLEKEGVSDLNERSFEPFAIDILVKPEIENELPRGIRAVHTPGHTWDLMSYWIPDKQILIASEAVAAYHNDGDQQIEFLVDFDKYLESLVVIKNLGARILCPGHHAVFTDQDVRLHIQASLEAAINYLAMVEQYLDQEKGDIDRVVSRIKASEWDNRPSPKQPESAYLLNTRQRVKTIWERMNG